MTDFKPFGYYEAEYSKPADIVLVFQKLHDHFKKALATQPNYKLWLTFSDIKPKNKKLKTKEQLGYLHACVLPILTQCLKSTGELDGNEDQTKFWLKILCNYGELVKVGDNVHFCPKSFEDITTSDLAAITERAIMEASERGWYIPPPTKGKKKFSTGE